MRRSAYRDIIVLESSGESYKHCIFMLFLNDPRRSGEDPEGILSLTSISRLTGLKQYAKQFLPLFA